MNILKYLLRSINKQKEEFINDLPPFNAKTLFKSSILVKRKSAEDKTVESITYGL